MQVFSNRIFQNDEGNITQIVGKTIESLICIETYNEDNQTRSPCVFWLKLKEETGWHRFFLDNAIGFCYWSLYQQLDESDLKEPETFPWYELSKIENLIGLTILQARVFPINTNGVQLIFELSCQRKMILYCQEIDGKNNLLVV
jgi:hypothetical protein